MMKNKLSLAVLLTFLIGLTPFAVVSAQSYTVSPTGWTSQPSTKVTTSSSTWIAATTEGIYIKAKAVVSGSTLTFYVQKSSGTFVNKANFLIQEDMTISGSSVTSNGTTVATGSVAAGSSGTTVDYEPDFTSGSHTYRILLSSGSLIFYTNPITVTAKSITLDTPDYTEFYATNITTTGFTANWEEVDGATSYNINVKESDGSYPSTPTTTSTTNQVKITGLKPGTAYRFQVQAVKGSAKSTWSKSNSSDIVTLANLTITGATYFGTTELTAGKEYTFTAVVKNSASVPWYGRFYLKCGDTNWIPWETPRTIAAGGTSTVTGKYTPTETGTKTLGFYYKTETTSKGALVSQGSYSNPFTVTVAAPLATPDYTEFYATNITMTGFTANWEEVDGATSYNINVKESDGSYPSTPTTTSTTNQVKITGLKPGTAYRFQVQAVKGSTKSTWSKSNSSDIVTLANLTITGATYFGTTELIAGKEYTFTAVVKNSASVPWYGRFYLKCGDTNWIPWETPRTIAAGGTSTVTGKYTPTETGTKTLGFYYKTETTSKGALVSQGSYSNPFTVIVSSSLATPDYTTFSASNITTTGFTAKWAKVSGATSYNINIKESDGSYPNTPTTTSTRDSVKITGLKPGTAYRFQVQAVNGSGKSSWSKSIQEDIITKSDNCPFPDCPGGEICEASTYLYNLGILEGVDGKLLPDDPMTRAQLAKLSLYSLYSGPSNIPSTLVSDKFPSIYPDLQDPRAYYYRPAKALLYLEYQDGVSPFDRNRSFFNPEKNIERNLVLKVICETFNIKPETSTSNNPFSDFDTNQTAWGYAKKCYDLGIAKLVNTTKFRPLDACKRKEAILYLYRVLTSSKVTVPKPRNAYTPSESSFFIPANLSAKTMGVMKGIEAGNFNFYQKDFFNIDGYMPLDFGVTYNSCLTEMPSDFYPVSPMGTAWSHTYNAYMTIINDANNENKTIVFHNADGSMLLYNYDDLESQTEGNYFTLERQQSSRYTLTSPGGTVYTFVRSYAADNIYYLTTITDRNENTLTITYEDGVTMTPHNTYIRRVKTVSTLGRDLTFAYTSGTDLLKTATDPSGRTVSFTYNGNNLASLKDAKGQTTSFTYGTSVKETSLLKSITLPKGNVIKNGYYQRKLTSTQYNKETPTRVKVTTNYTSGTTNTEVIQPVTSSDSITTKIKLDGLGRVKSATDNDKNDVSMTYGDADNSTLPTKIVDNKTGITTTLTYNKKGKVTKRVISSGGSSITEKYSYTPYNDIESYTDANGNITKYEYTDGNLTSVTDAMGNVTNITNNSNGAPTAITDPMGRIVKMQYNSYGNVNKVTQSALSISTSFGYDNISRITSTTNLNGKKTTYKYDKNDNVVSVTDPLNNTTLFTFDANDNLTKITNAKGKETTLTYDDDDLLTEQSFQGSTKSFSYNIDGSLSSSTSANGDIRNYSYDESGDIIDDDYASYTYNSKGWLSSIEKDGKSIDYYYDALGRVSSEEYDGQEVGYYYDDNGNVTSITYPGDKTVNYTYDALNRVTAVTDWNGAKTTYSYNDDSSINYVQLPNKVRTTYTYDKAGRVTGITTKRNSGSGTAIAAYTFTMDKMGNHLTEKVTEPYGEIPDPTAGTTNYTYNAANRVTKAGDISFAYDKNGNATSRTGRTMKYDIINNLIKVTGDFSATYTYDGLGNRRSATRGGTTTKYVLIGNNVIAETNSSNKVQYYYVYGPTGLIARITPSGTTRYYVSDYRGSVVAMTDATTDANVTHQYQYDDFGQVLQSHEENTNLFRYVGVHGVMHETNGLTFMRARYYDPTIGRFNSEDPIWSTNLYPYADNNPIMGIDPRGTFTLEGLANAAGNVFKVIDVLREHVVLDTNVEVCGALGFGGCAGFDVVYDKDGFGINANGGGVVGLGNAASINPTVSWVFSENRQNPDKRSSVVLDFGGALGPKYGLSLEAERDNKVISANSSIGLVTVGGTVGEEKTISVGVQQGVGGGVFAGVKHKTPTFRPFKNRNLIKKATKVGAKVISQVLTSAIKKII